MIYLQLFFAFLQVGLFSIGGGHASIPVAQSIVVDKCAYLTAEEFSQMLVISEMTPGPFGINVATFVGLKTGGVLGGIISTVSFLLPSFFICLIAYKIFLTFKNLSVVNGFMRGIRPCVSGLISSAVFSIFMLSTFGFNHVDLVGELCFSPLSFCLTVIAFMLARKTRLNPVLIIILSGAICAFI